MVFGVLGALAGFVKVRVAYTFVDSQVFRLHYHWTAAFCFIGSALVSASGFVGESIHCLEGFTSAPDFVSTYCWVSSTFTINSTSSDIRGLGQHKSELHEKTIHAYYQWVPHVLFLQGILFYLPHLLWKTMEGKRVDNLLQGLNKSLFDEDEDSKKKNIVNYLSESWGLNNKYGAGYLFCEVLNLVNVVGQMFLIDQFLGWFFMDYGTKAFEFFFSNDKDRSDPLYETFPRLTKCSMHSYGPSGDIRKLDYLCVLPLNIMNEKVFLVMWLWFVFLTTVTCVQIVWQLMVCYSPLVRLRLLQHHTKAKLSQKTEHMIRSMPLGDYCLLEALGRNLNPLAFHDILNGITDIGYRYLSNGADFGTYRPSAPAVRPMDNMYPTLPVDK